MANILERIIAHKEREIQSRKELYPLKLLEQSIYFETKCVSLAQYLSRSDRVGIIAEIKRTSPSRGVLHPNVSVENVSIGYMQAGASALSILTDTEFFGGSNQDLTTARKFNFCPILRKDFIIDEYQVVEAKSIGADAILLIAAALSGEAAARLANCAKGLGMEVLFEVHSAAEIERGLPEGVNLVGVNNRDLGTLAVNTNTSFELLGRIPAGVIKVTESGIDSAETFVALKKAGYQGVLMGEAFMRTAQPEKECARFIERVHQLIREGHAQG